MRKKSPAGRMPKEKKTKKIVKKIKADYPPASKAGRRGKEFNKPATREKTSRAKVPLKTSVKKDIDREKEKSVKKKEKPVVKSSSPNKEKLSVRESSVKKKGQAVLKKIKTVSSGKPKTVLTGKGKVVKKAKPLDPSAKAGTVKKGSLPRTKKKAAPISSVKSSRERKDTAGSQETPKKVEKRKMQPVAAKKKRVLSGKLRKDKVQKILLPEVDGQEMRQKKIAKADRVKGLKGKTATKRKETKKAVGGGESGKIFAYVALEPLLVEYGENEIVLITVDPHQLFAFWEVREDELKRFKGILTIRLYDISGIDFDYMDANRYVDREVRERIGDLYLEVEPAKEYIADIGTLSSEGIFITIARSLKVSTPCIALSEVCETPAQIVETIVKVGYSSNK